MEWLGMIFCLLGIIVFCFIVAFIMMSILVNGEDYENHKK